MKTMLSLVTPAFAALTCASCFVINLDFSYTVTNTGVDGGAASSSSSTGGAPLCTPGAMQPCYSGPTGTEGQGVCQPGAETCAADGTSWGPCVGEVLPQVEDCATPEDEDCDGKAPACKGALVWAKRFGDAGEQRANGVTADASGDVLVAGSFSGAIDFGGGPLTSAGGSDVFVVKLDPSGAHLWSKTFGDATTQTATSIAVDASGNVIVAGSFSGAVDFGGGMLTSAGGSDVFVVKLDPSGAHLWSKGFGDTEGQAPLGAATDPGGAVLITGYFAGAVDFGGGLLMSESISDAFAVKLDPLGAHVWSKRFGSAGATSDGHSITASPSGNVLATGSFSGAIDFGNGPLTSAGVGDIFLVGFDASGAHPWSNRFGTGSSMDSAAGAGVATDASGNLLVTGSFSGAIDFGSNPLASAGSLDVFLAKLDAVGGHVWSKRFGDGATQQSSGVTADVSGNVLVTGSFSSAIDFGGGPLVSAGGLDMFVAKFSP